MASPNALNNLPHQLTSFIGREHEIAEVQRLLGSARLLTLTGAGGTGKTRLSLQVARNLLGEFEHGIFFVSLASIIDPLLVASAISQALNVHEIAGQPITQGLKAFLNEKQALLLLDNFEQILDAAPLVVDLLVSAPDLKVLVTSRQHLRVHGEQIYPVPPMTLPHRQDKSLEALSENEAVALFVQRAQAANPTFGLTEHNVQVVAEICRKLDGLPLAIELAAARMLYFTPHVMLPLLDSRLKLLTSGARDVSTRQQTLRAAIDWSYNLLSPPEKALFRRISVFQGGHTLKAVESMCNAHDGLQIDVLEEVLSLVDKSLLKQAEGANGEPRFRLLETIREFAGEKLEQSGETQATRRLHALYFMALAEEAEPHLTRARQVEWLNLLDDEQDNIRAALEWVAEHAQSSDGNEAAEVGVRIAIAVIRYWDVRGLYREGREHLARILALSEATPQALPLSTQAKLLIAMGIIAWRQDDRAAANSALEGALALAREAGDKESIAHSLHALATVNRWQDDFLPVRALYEESLALRRESGDKQGIADLLDSLGIAIQYRGDYATARAMFDESLALRKETQDSRGIANSLYNLGNLTRWQGNYSVARGLLEESLALNKEVGDKDGIGSALYTLGNLEYQLGSCSAARSLYKEGLLTFRELGTRGDIGVSLGGLGGAEAEVGNLQRAARLLGAAESFVQDIRRVAPLFEEDIVGYERGMAQVRSRLGAQAFKKAWQDGKAMSMEQAIEYAFDETLEPEHFAPSTPKSPYPNELSKREVEVLRLLPEGLTNEEMATRLFLTTNTVRAHLHSIFGKLDVRSRGAAARFAIESKLIHLGGE